MKSKIVKLPNKKYVVQVKRFLKGWVCVRTSEHDSVASIEAGCKAKLVSFTNFGDSHITLCWYDKYSDVLDFQDEIDSLLGIVK